MSQKFERLKALLKELFQLDQPDLDFGLYRIMHAKSAEVTQFLDQHLLPQVKDAFALYKSADKSEIEKLIELTRRAQEIAEQAQAEARRAREHSEVLQQRLDKTEREFALLRQTMAANVTAAPNATLPAMPKPVQQSAEQKPDSRLANLEDQLEINTAQLKEHAQTKIESGSRMKVKLYGEILFNMYLNSNDSANGDVPTIAFPDVTTNGRKRNNLGASLRQTKIGLARASAMPN